MNYAQILLTTAPALGLAAYCLSHVLACRTIRGRGNYFPLMLGCGCGFAVAAVISLAASLLIGNNLVDMVAVGSMNVVCYLALAFGYFNFINLNIASLRIRMLQELAESGGSMAADDLTALYDVDSVIALRIDRLVAGGHLIERDGRYYSGKRKFLIVGRIFDFLRLVILGGRMPLTNAAPANEISKSNVRV
jgi:hypothetical protein